jgi:hypothetical protein
MTKSMILSCLCAVASVCFPRRADAQTYDAVTESHIEDIANDLLPPVLIEGQPIPGKTLSERRAELHVPGVSIAYIHDGRVAYDICSAKSVSSYSCEDLAIHRCNAIRFCINHVHIVDFRAFVPFETG